MFARTLLATLLAGILAGLLITPVHYAKTVPLILAAETFEGSGEGGGDHPHHSGIAFVTPAHAHSGEGEVSDAARLGGTVLANVVAASGLALLLLAASLLIGQPLTAANGALWGVAGFVIVTLAPALGLPPELPAMPAADLFQRQIWWMSTVVCSAVGLYALVFLAAPAWKIAGAVVLLLPHLVGAPHPADLTSPVPPTLAAEFAVASLATTALLWLLIGVFAGWALDRARRAEAAA